MRFRGDIFLVGRWPQLEHAFNRLSALLFVLELNDETRRSFGSFSLWLLRFAGFGMTSLGWMSNFRSCCLLRNTGCTRLAYLLMPRFNSVGTLRFLLQPV